MNIVDVYNIREWAPLTDIVDKLPPRSALSFFPLEVNITCVDAVSDFLALGTDVGTVFWYNRNTGIMSPLKLEVQKYVTCVKICDTVDYMVAAGSISTQISIFQIPKEPATELIGPRSKPKLTERYVVRNQHEAKITYCVWTKNGMKLYSGDQRGNIVLTVFDYTMRHCMSSLLLSEAYAIVQINIHQSYLLISTTYRTIICQELSEDNTSLTQVGATERLEVLECGSTFLKRNKKQIYVLSARPSHKIWLTNIEGVVQRSFTCKEDAAEGKYWEIPILNPKKTNETGKSVSASEHSEMGLRRICMYGNSETFIATYDVDTLYIVDITTFEIEAIAKGMRGILDVCVSGNEIFVLEGPRSLLRLSPVPDKPIKGAKIIFNPVLTRSVFKPNLGVKKLEKAVECEADEDAAAKAVECFERSLNALSLDIPVELSDESPRDKENRRLESLNNISDLDFDQSIVHRSGTSASVRRRKRNLTPPKMPSEDTYKSVAGGTVFASAVVPIDNPAIVAAANYALASDLQRCGQENVKPCLSYIIKSTKNFTTTKSTPLMDDSLWEAEESLKPKTPPPDPLKPPANMYYMPKGEAYKKDFTQPLRILPISQFPFDQIPPLPSPLKPLPELISPAKLELSPIATSQRTQSGKSTPATTTTQPVPKPLSRLSPPMSSILTETTIGPTTIIVGLPLKELNPPEENISHPDDPIEDMCDSVDRASLMVKLADAAAPIKRTPPSSPKSTADATPIQSKKSSSMNSGDWELVD